MSPESFDLFARRESRVYKVSELTRELKGLIEGRFPSLRVEGEVSNLRRAPSGHVYFTLKDAGASLRCALFRNQARLLRFQPSDGQLVVARGRLSLYEPSGDYSLVCDALEPLGAGELALQFERLKARLEAEGLFDPGLKRQVPFLPRRIGVVTSPSGAAIHDFLRVLLQRWPDIPVLVAPARVQGAGAAAEIAAALARVAAIPDVDVVVLTRGGGSLEDLWCFNEELVARAIRRCPVPVVSAVGHEVDFTIADFAADLRAPTPTAAAEHVVPAKTDLRSQLAVTRGRLVRACSRLLEQRRARLSTLQRSLGDPRGLIASRRLTIDRLLGRSERTLRESLRRGRASVALQLQQLQQAHPRAQLTAVRSQVQTLEARLRSTVARRLAGDRQSTATLAARLDALSPLKVLSRGYALSFDASGRLLTDAARVQPGEIVHVQLANGRFDARVIGVGPTDRDGGADGLTAAGSGSRPRTTGRRRGRGSDNTEHDS